MQIQLEVPEHVIDKYIQKQADKGITVERNEAAATEAYTEYVITSYMFPINPDGSMDTERKLSNRVFALLTAATTVIGRMQLKTGPNSTARDMIDLIKMNFGGNNGK